MMSGIMLTPTFYYIKKLEEMVMLKEYKKPVVVGNDFDNAEISKNSNEVVGIIPFLAAAATAAVAVSKAASLFDDAYMDYQIVGKLDKVE